MARIEKSEVKVEKKVKDEFKLPKYLMLSKGAMWLDDQGENCSGIRLFAIKKVLIGRDTHAERYINKEGKEATRPVAGDIKVDEFQNKNLLNYGTENAETPWYFDTTEIPPERLSNILTAFKYGILVEADPENPPMPVHEVIEHKDFKIKDNGERIFVGKNAEMFKKLQNMNFDQLRNFIKTCPNSDLGKTNLLDLLNYETKGYNPLNRYRFEVGELIKNKLKEFGNFISPIRINED